MGKHELYTRQASNNSGLSRQGEALQRLSRSRFTPAGLPPLMILLFLIAGFVANGCAESSNRRAERLGEMLAAAGFRAVPADTPARVQRLNQMTPLKVSYLSHHGNPSYWFADPYVCHCLYVGSQRNYDEFQQHEQERAEESTQQYDQHAFDQFMASPANQVFYGQ